MFSIRQIKEAQNRPMNDRFTNWVSIRTSIRLERHLAKMTAGMYFVLASPITNIRDTHIQGNTEDVLKLNIVDNKPNL